MTARNWSQSWTAFASHELAGDHERVRIDSSLTRATATHAVAACCGSGTSRTPFQSGATSACNEPLDQDVRWSLTKRSTRDAMWSSAASIGSNSGVGWQPGTRNAP